MLETDDSLVNPETISFVLTPYGLIFLNEDNVCLPIFSNVSIEYGMIFLFDDKESNPVLSVVLTPYGIML